MGRAPRRIRISGGEPVTELRAAVAALHEAGMEVWLDVVFNHTCEGSLGSGPILSWRGFDNAAAYRLIEGPEGLVDDDVTGCGNAIDTQSAVVRRLIRELLVRWVEEWGIDGFRFDLAATLIREDDGPTVASAFLAELQADERLDRTRLIAEPWDTGLGGYAVGSFPPPWREWNDRFRDDVRDVWRGQPGRWSALAGRITGSADLFRPAPDEPTATPRPASTPWPPTTASRSPTWSRTRSRWAAVTASAPPTRGSRVPRRTTRSRRGDGAASGRCSARCCARRACP
ncbi:hypothetical protein ACE2AJ_02685 [Aquihabitans daechungensis]|uniref:hypothetical protein n=1 Tax=Aquihabitans daechungensis TaxID=1052257 RepID=UPI003BA0F212